MRSFVAAFLDFPKPLIAAVNGASIGIMFTTLPLFDLVYASPKATFFGPFVKLGQVPEGCSSLTFPRLMGHSKAMEVLVLGRKLDAKEALTLGLVNEVIHDGDFFEGVQHRVGSLVNLPIGSIIETKTLLRKWNVKELHKVNEEECKVLVQRWQTEECMEAVNNFFQRKAKL